MRQTNRVITSVLSVMMTWNGAARGSGDDATGQIEQARVTVDFRRTPLESALEEIARQAGVGLTIDWPALREAKIAGDTAISVRLTNVKAAAALDAVVRQARRGTAALEWWINEDVLNITTRTAASWQPVTVTYSCRQHLATALSARERLEVERAVTALWRTHFAVFAPPWRGLPSREAGGETKGPRVGVRREVSELLDALHERVSVRRMEEVAEAIRSAVSPESWRERGGTVGSVRVVGETLVVTQTPAAQRRVRDLLRGGMAKTN
jgi:hypothetical protein